MNEGLLTIDDFDTLCYGFNDEIYDSDYLSEGLSQSLFLIMQNYPNEEFTKKVVDAIEIFNNHALFSYGYLLTYWFVESNRITSLCAHINTKNDKVKGLFRKAITSQIEFLGDSPFNEYLVKGANNVLQCIE
ncbi:hypothetical protein [Emticicia sp. C21]|uniref:hypothetical protein n=1 Tax=Emticicia sp. C21 TaxID=2302915 RepID=UPI000E34F601|nr:hypothetical protein [Emticicia sp. C21]RFS15321.1 hypothetical protein D0T08_17515 [Emticicia sp. C21]